MTAPLLQTKLLIPPARSSLVTRPQLFKLLDQGLEKKLILVSAPAGYGKTTLLSSWAVHARTAVPSDQQTKIAWLSLDEADNDPARFLAYFIAALQTIQPEFGEGLLKGFQPQSITQATDHLLIEDIQTIMINQINAIPDNFALILDDFHVLTSHPAQVFIAYLIEHLPPQMHLLIAGRADPPLPLARLRARGQLVELRQSDLQFSQDEAAEFFTQVMGLRLTPRNIHALAERTEGWIAGLQMASLALKMYSGQEEERLVHFIQSFTGSNRFILDYLMEEVLARQPEEVQTFLLITSILDRMCAPLCDSIIGTGLSSIEEFKTSQELLEYLERTNLFVIPLDDRREWYRYHRLFSDLLRKRLQQTLPNEIPALHRYASAWLQANGLLSESIQHALQARDSAQAASLIENIAESVLMRGEVVTLIGWINQLPSDLIHSHPILDLYFVTGLLLAGQSQETIQDGLTRLGRWDNISAEVKVLRAYMALYQVHLIEAEKLSREALEDFPAGSTFFRSMAFWISNYSQVTVNDLALRAEFLEAAVRNSQTLGNRLLEVSALSQLAESRFNLGQLQVAQKLFQRAIDLATEPDGQQLPIAGLALIGMGNLLREWNELDTAATVLERGIDLFSHWREYGAIEGNIALALCRQEAGDLDGAMQAIQESMRLAKAFEFSQLDDQLVDLIHAQMLLREGDTLAVERYFNKYHPPVSGLQLSQPVIDTVDLGTERMWKYEQVALGRGLLAQVKPAEALEVLDALLPELEKNKRIGLIIEVEILRALAYQILEQTETAEVSFDRALALAEPGAYIRLFIDEGKPLARLLENSITKGVNAEYAARLLDAFLKKQDKITHVESRAHTGFSEPLSERELEVLRFLRSNLTVPEIAQELYLAESTVRSHVKNIYSKLNVHRRMDAIHRAEELGLFSLT